MQIIVSEDVISRSVIKEQMIKYGFHASDMTVTEFVEDLQPITSQLNIGHWIKVSNGFKCSKCFIVHLRTSIYCPKCGAKMVEPQESEDKE